MPWKMFPVKWRTVWFDNNMWIGGTTCFFSGRDAMISLNSSYLEHLLNLDVNNVTEPLESFQNDQLTKFKNAMGKVGFFVAIVGMMANLMCLLVLLHPTQRQCKRNSFLISLVISDCLLLYFAGLSTYLRMLRDISMPGFLGQCNVENYFILTTACLSNIMIALFTLSRALIVYIPTKYDEVISKKLINTAIPLIWIVILLIQTPHLVKLEWEKDCLDGSNWNSVYRYYRHIMQIGLAHVIPDTIIFTGNLAIISKLYKGRYRGHDGMFESGPRGEPSRSIVGTCIGLGMCHLLMTLPFLVLILLQRTTDLPQDDQFYIIYTIFYLLMTANHAINFILYMMLSRSFRETLNSMFCCQATSIWKLWRDHKW